MAVNFTGQEYLWIGEGTDYGKSFGIVRMITSYGSIYEGLLDHQGNEIGWGVCYFEWTKIGIGFCVYGS